MRRRNPKTLSILLVLLGICMSGFSAVHAERLRVFTETDYSGQETIFRDPVPNLTALSSPPKIASVRVVTGRWLVCANANFGGDCAWLSHDISSLPDLGFTDLPGSLRPERVPVLERHWGNRRPAAREALALFERAGYDGEWTALSDSVRDFDAAHLKSPGSVVLGDGVWRLCTGPDYTGRCLILNGSVWNLAEIFLGQFRSAQRHVSGSAGWATIVSDTTTPPLAKPPASFKCPTRKAPTQVKTKAGKMVWRCVRPTR